ncbi:hypothetical protein [Blastococcus sp. LR1]|uniref:hypothetical protein n=1 Tax=Blastococcus sp. LR1 TaxID=2877000 RepID=UPI001CCFCF64|nr:hypothetical protein [Blastococcus sp. LR1]MCA0146664.1 hypothetical protein [Blastococcus sp. LR1]
MIEHDYPDALTHHYKPTASGQAIPLYVGGLRFSDDEEGHDWHGRAEMAWYPSPRVMVEASRPNRGIEDFVGLRASGKREWVEMPSIKLPGEEVPLPPQPDSLSEDSRPSGVSRNDRLTPQTLGSGTALSRVTFLIPNGWDVPNGSGVCDPEDLVRTWNGRLEAFPSGWRITIDRRPEVNKQFLRRLRDENTSAVTHIGQIARADGSLFDVADIQLLLQALRLAFSLAVGRTINLLLPVGWWGDQAVWTRWVSPHIDGVLNTGTFLDRHKGNEQMRELIERVVDYCRTPERLEVIQYATSYYVTATYDVDVELGVALPISGLQLLAYNRFVEERGTHTQRQWENLKPTEAQIRLLLDDCRMRTSVPASYPHLAEVSRRAQMSEGTRTARDALGCVMLLRNKIIHPTSTKPGAWTAYQWAEGKDYAAHCLLLAILNTVGYRGQHRSAWADDIWEGVTDPVPWATATEGPEF